MDKAKIFSTLTPEDIIQKSDTYQKCLLIVQDFKKNGSPSAVIEGVFSQELRERLIQTSVQKITQTLIERCFCLYSMGGDAPPATSGHFVLMLFSLLYGNFYEEGEDDENEEEDNTTTTTTTEGIYQVREHIKTLRELLITICYTSDVECSIREQIVLVAQRYMSNMVHISPDLELVRDTIDTLALLSVVSTATAISLYADTLEGSYTQGDTPLAFQFYEDLNKNVEKWHDPVFVTTWHEWVTKEGDSHKGSKKIWIGPVGLLHRDRSKLTGWVSEPMRLGIIHTASTK